MEELTDNDKIIRIKADIFDILNMQETLSMQIRGFEQAKQQKLAELAKLTELAKLAEPAEPAEPSKPKTEAE